MEEEAKDQRKNLHKATQSCDSHPGLHDAKAQALLDYITLHSRGIHAVSNGFRNQFGEKTQQM